MNQMIVRTVCALTLSGAWAGTSFAQRAVTVAGHVTSRGAPLPGAHVRVDELRIDRTTDAEGRYSFVVPSSSVHGQNIKVVATMSDRRLRYLPVSATLALTG